MVHYRQRATLGVESVQHLTRVVTGADQLQSHAPAHRLHLLRLVHHPHSAAAQHLNDPVRSDALREFLLVVGNRCDHDAAGMVAGWVKPSPRGL